MRLVFSAEGEANLEDVVELHHVPVVVCNAVRDLDVSPLPQRGLVDVDAICRVFLKPGQEQRIEFSGLVDDVVVDRLHRLQAEKRLQVAVVEVRRDVAREDP